MFFRTLLLVLLFGTLVGCVTHSSQHPLKGRPHYTLGLSFLQSGNPTMALKQFLLAVEQDPRDPQIHAGLARAYQLKKAYPQAEQSYLEALRLSNNEPRYQNNLAALYLTMERWDLAIDYFTKASQDLLFMRSELALMGKGYALYRKGEYLLALDSYREAEAIAPRLASLHFHIAETYVAMGRTELAKAAFEKSIQYYPGYPEASYQYAVLLLKENQIEKAKDLLNQIVEEDPLSDWGGKAADFLKVLK